MPATITRQIRLHVPEHEALTKAAPAGEGTNYIQKALRNQLVADGFMPAPEPPPPPPFSNNGRRKTSRKKTNGRARRVVLKKGRARRRAAR